MEGLTATKNTSLFQGTIKDVCEHFHFWSIAEHKKNSITGATLIKDSKEDDDIPDSTDSSKKLIDLKTNPPTSPKYPNCDLNIWLRTCEVEILNPLEGIATGAIPTWVNGNLNYCYFYSEAIVLTN